MQLKRKVVILQSNEKAKVGDMIQCVNPSEKFKAWKNILGTCHISESSKEWKKIDLYFLSDEEIKKGDWFYDNKHPESPIEKCFGISWKNKNDLFTDEYQAFTKNKSYCKKIIATTDKTLNLPQPSESFIEFYIKTYNEGNPITKVMIEYDEFYELNDPTGKYTERELKVESDGTVSIRKVKESWNREEVIEFGLKCANLGMDLNNNPLPRLNEISGKEYYYKWLENNL